MTTFRQVKHRAYMFTIEQLSKAKTIALKHGRLELFWAYAAAQTFVILRESNDKLFWWRLTVKSIRYSNDHRRMKVW